MEEMEIENNNKVKDEMKVFNPFRLRLPELTLYDYIKYAVMFPFIFIRFCGIITLMMLAYILACIGLWGVSDEEIENKPFSGWRRKLKWYIWKLGKLHVKFYGFVNVKTTGTPASRDEAPIMVVGPHTGFFDGIACWYADVTMPSLVSRAENSSAYFFGKYIKYIQSVYVMRQSQASRSGTVQNIIERVNSKDDWPPLMIFPEGTTNNGEQLILFKLGAFLPGLPVQPVVIRYPNQAKSTSWTWDGPSAPTLLYRTLSQFVSYAEVHYLPVYKPSEEERSNPRIFANNVRNVMARALGIPTSNLGFDDARLMESAIRLKLPPSVGLIEFHEVHEKFGLDVRTVRNDYLPMFAKLCNSQGYIDVNGFASGLFIPLSSQIVVQLFNIYDEIGSGRISFKEYIISRFNHTQKLSSEDKTSLTFQYLGSETKQNISLGLFTEVVYSQLNVSPENCRKIFTMATENEDLSYGEYASFIKHSPEYAWLILEARKNSINHVNAHVDNSRIKSE